MMCEPKDEDYSSDEDDDYLPSGEASEGESEADDLEEEGGYERNEVKVQQKSKVKKGGSKRQQKNNPEIKRSRTGGIHLPEGDTEGPSHKQDAEEAVGTLFKEEELSAAKMRKETNEKQKADDLWSSFMKDVGHKPKANKMQSNGQGSSTSLGDATKQVSSGTNGQEMKPEKNETTGSAVKKTVTVTEVFDFAGEEVKVTKEVAVDSKEAKQLLQPCPPTEDIAAGMAPKSTPLTSSSKRPGGGLSNVLGLINKKPKISVLEKSRLDWSNFTTKEGISDELKLHNKGKGGYIEKQKFLAQSDQRQYEKERDLRMGSGKR